MSVEEERFHGTDHQDGDDKIHIYGMPQTGLKTRWASVSARVTRLPLQAQGKSTKGRT